MLEFVFGIGKFFVDHVSQFDRNIWLWVSVGVIGLGFMCMRGFGSRTNY